MKRTPLVKRRADGAIGHGRQIAHGKHVIHVLEEPTHSPQNPFIGDFLIWKGSNRLFRRDINGQWGAVYHKSSVYQDVIARLYEEGIDQRAGDGS